MTYRIHYTVGGEEDYIDLSANTIEELQQLTQNHLARVGGTDEWSEQING